MKIRSCLVFFTVLLYSFNETTSSDFNSEENTTGLNEIETERNISSVCGAVYVEKQFALKSPNYPENYPLSVECNYLFKGPHCPTYYEFEFLDFNLEESLGCTKDRLEIVGQEALCGNYVGNKVKMYFAGNGSLHIKFVADRNISARGYNIQITRTACNKVDSNFEIEETTTEFLEETTTEENTEGTTVLIESRNFPTFIQEEKEKECCSSNYNSKRFLLTSPDFPYSLNKKTECVYHIRKANDNICRLRLNFLFFWLGFTNYQNYCPYGSLEIDGKHICGCNKDVQLTTAFGNSDVKVLKFKTEGFYQNQNYYTGFVVEIIQDECPKKYSPQNLNQANNNCSTEDGYYKDEISRVAWSNDLQHNFIEKLQLINERTELLDDDDEIYQQNKPKIVKRVYFFAAPEYNDVPSLFKEKEKTTHIDTSDINYVLTNINYHECLNWNQIQYNFLERNYGRSLQTCKTKDGSISSTQSDKNCIELDYINGYFRSPGYPYYYPGNLNICYRFKKQRGYCKIKMFMHDFQIEDSFGCDKDYILLANGYKYCGQNLFKVSWTMDMQSKDYEDMKFVTDAYYCGRGFSGVYQQIACQDMTFPINPADPSTPPFIPTTSRPIYCDKLIKEESFTIEVRQDYKMCTFTIQKSSKDVCKINLYFEKFNLLCTHGVLLIDGTTYCGNLVGRMVAINTYGNPKSIVYRRIAENKHDDMIIKIRGQQISNDCLFPEVPAERILDTKVDELQILTDADKNLTAGYFQNNSKYLVALLNKQFKDICGIVTNTTDKELPPTFCQVLMNEHNVTKCIPLHESSSGVPYETKKPEVNVKSINIIKDVEFHEIDCDKFIIN